MNLVCILQMGTEARVRQAGARAPEWRVAVGSFETPERG